MWDCQAFLKKGISINLYISTAAIKLGKKSSIWGTSPCLDRLCWGGGGEQGGAGLYRHISLFCKKKNVLIRTFFKNV